MEKELRASWREHRAAIFAPLWKEFLFISLLFLFILSCSGRYQVVELPLRGADLYPVSQTREKIAVAVNQIGDAEASKRYFGVNLLREDIVPVNIIISNLGEHRCSVHPADVLLLRDRQVIDPLPVQWVAGIAKKKSGSGEAGKEVEAYLTKISLKETVVLPHDSYQGVLFFKMGETRAKRSSIFSILRMFGNTLKMRIAVSDLDTGQRIHFGPFSLPAIEAERS